MKKVKVFIANSKHFKYSQTICDVIEESAKIRGTGIAKREPKYIQTKMENQNAIIALDSDGNFAGFCYIETWGHGEYVSNSGLIVHPSFRNLGLAKRIKKRAFDHARKKFPEAKVFGITTSLAVLKINHSLGYQPVTFSELTQDEAFWKGCQSCTNFDILQKNQQKLCLCTGMVALSASELKARSEARAAAKKKKENTKNKN